MNIVNLINNEIFCYKVNLCKPRIIFRAKILLCLKEN